MTVFEKAYYFIILLLILSPLIGSLISGLLGKKIGYLNSHRVAILGVFLSFVSACYINKIVFIDQIPALNHNLYVWGDSGIFTFHIGYIIDALTAIMIFVVTSVSLLVHIYSIGYMHGDPGYARFFSYMSLFTFFMLMLVIANNFLQLFFGWEGVGLVSYLLIGFWYQKDSANVGSFKAFIVNRVGDMGFVLGIGAIIDNFNSLDYATVFNQLQHFSHATISLFPGTSSGLFTVIGILLFIGAMGKSAQIPLHIWLPESMEGPTPISALIHAATMVTAGVFMVARMSPIYQYSPDALSFILVIGATGALFTGLIAIVQNDIKRVIAYSTLSQLGYMIAAAGASAFSASIFHLFTHAFFKALLFLAAGSVILAMHHEQDMRKMGGLWKYLPITYICFLIGSLALTAIPPFAGYYSKDIIIEAIKYSTLPGAHYAYICTLLGAAVTAFYTFRAFFKTFHGKPRFELDMEHPIQESPWVVWLPLILLAIPSGIIGYLFVVPFVADSNSLINQGFAINPQLDSMQMWIHHFHGAFNMALDAWKSPAYWMSVFGIVLAWFFYGIIPSIPGLFKSRFSLIYRILVEKYGFDRFNDIVFVNGTKQLSKKLYELSDQGLIDNVMVNGSGRFLGWMSIIVRKIQTGYVYDYIFVMFGGMVLLIWWLIY